MKATDFEYRHQLLLHELIVGAALLTYLIDRDDVVWRFIKTGENVRLLERLLFAVATLLFAVSAWVCTRARGYREVERTTSPTRLAGARSFRSSRQLLYIGEYLYALALASLVPLAGALILIIGEGIRLFRLFERDIKSAESGSLQGLATSEMPRSEWGKAFRREAIKWGLFVTMIVFTLTLKDRIAEVLIDATVVLWIFLNLRLSALRRCLRVCLADRHA